MFGSMSVQCAIDILSLELFDFCWKADYSLLRIHCHSSSLGSWIAACQPTSHIFITPFNHVIIAHSLDIERVSVSEWHSLLWLHNASLRTLTEGVACAHKCCFQFDDSLLYSMSRQPLGWSFVELPNNTIIKEELKFITYIFILRKVEKGREEGSRRGEDHRLN